MKKVFLTGLLLTTSLYMAENANAQDIFSILADTYTSNPTLQSQRAYLRSVDENIAIAKSGYRPNISLQGAYRDGENKIKKGIGQGGDYNNLSGSAVVSQPVFSGFSTVNSVKAADRAIKAAQNSLSNIEQNILLEASTAYLDVLQNRAIVVL